MNSTVSGSATPGAPVTPPAAGKGRFLGIDTATEACSVALWIDGKVLARHQVGSRDHAALLRAQVGELLAEAGIVAAQLDGLACGIGPGSFAGVRTGVAFVQGLALALERRVVPVISLELLATPLLGAGAKLAVATIDARMGEVYHGVYRLGPGGRPVPVAPPSVTVPTAVAALADADFSAAGSGWVLYAPQLSAALGGEPQVWDVQALPDIAVGMPWIAATLQAGRGLDPAVIQPLYLRNKVAMTKAEQEASRRQ